jgi:hypothetical protein
MKLEKINVWLGLLGQLAVFGGLVALVIEIRSNTQSIRAQELASISDRLSARQLALMGPDIRGVYTKALFSPNDLTLEEMLGVSIFLNYRLGTAFDAFTSAQNGTLTQSDWETSLRDTLYYLGTEFGRNWWELEKSEFGDYPGGEEFVESIDKTLNDGSGLPDDKFYAELCEKLGMSNCPPK